jgi:hypothetical protein
VLVPAVSWPSQAAEPFLGDAWPIPRVAAAGSASEDRQKLKVSRSALFWFGTGLEGWQDGFMAFNHSYLVKSLLAAG